ncbi:MAG: 50S ribosomal protein L30 [Deltaproteobacteria bacterium]|nr:50S ribosomal protein L30 [Deltaproteobacteria bacterium]
MTKILKITQVRSALGRIPKHRRTVRALGLKRIGDIAAQPDNPAIRGMIRAVGYLLKVEELEK